MFVCVQTVFTSYSVCLTVRTQSEWGWRIKPHCPGSLCPNSACMNPSHSLSRVTKPGTKWRMSYWAYKYMEPINVRIQTKTMSGDMGLYVTWLRVCCSVPGDSWASPPSRLHVSESSSCGGWVWRICQNWSREEESFQPAGHRNAKTEEKQNWPVLSHFEGQIINK